jgi:hypothetical protein
VEKPSQQLLQQALQLARRRGQPVYMYRQRDGWAIAERLADAAGFTMIEVAPNKRSETYNRGGC